MPKLDSDAQFRTIYHDLIDELQVALIKFPAFHSAHEGWAVIAEELDELWEVVRQKQSAAGRNVALYKEAKQVAAMAIRFMLDLPRFKN